MVKKTIIFGLLTFWLTTAVVLGDPIAVLNPSFEYVGGVPVGVKTMGVEPDDWSFGNGMPTGGGIENPSSDGDVCVALYNVDSIYQLLDHNILSSDEYTLEFDTYYIWASAGASYDCTFQGRLYYDDSGSRTLIDYIEANLTDSGVWHFDYTLNTTIPSGHAAIGKNLGIELTTDQGSGGNSWFGFDNVRLNVNPGMGVFSPDPADEQTGVSLSPTLNWQVSGGFTDPNFQVYFSDDEDDVTNGISSAFKGSQYETTYSPTSVQPGTYYYWRIDVIDNAVFYPGPVWQFSTEVELPNCLQVLLGDVDEDCQVNMTDLWIMAAQWLDEFCTPPWCADIDLTDGVGLPDFALLSADWQKSTVAGVVINEFMASNTTVLSDDDNEYPDWIELKNRFNVPVNLNGWYLTDDAQEPDKWQLADVTIDPGGFLVIFASSKDRNSDPNYPLHTNFNLDIRGEYLGLYHPDETVVDEFAPHFPTQAEDISYGLSFSIGDDEYTYGYFLEPTPGAENSISVSNLGPYIENVSHSPSEPCETDSIVVTATITPKLKPVDSVSLYYRVMYGGETSIGMFDDGAHDDGTAGDGVYGATIPSSIASPGEMLRYYITASDPNANSNRSPLALDLEGMRQSPEYYGMVVKDPALTSDIAILHWFVEDTAAADNRNYPRTGTRASVYYNGEFYDNIFCRVRGGSITYWEILNTSYKFEFNRGYYFRFSPSEARVDEFNLSSTYPDKAYIRQDIAFESFRDAGGEYCETFPMRVYRNDQFFSVQTFVEQVDGEYLERQGLDPDGALYKMYNTMNSTSSAEKKTREYEDNSDLQALVNGLALSGSAEELYLFDNINLPSVINYAATNTIINNLDHYAKNYYAYRDTNGTGEWRYLPWDVDLTFGKQWEPWPVYLLGDTLWYHNQWQNPAGAPNDDLQNAGGNYLLGAIYSNSRTNEMYHRRLRTLADQLLQAPGTPYGQRYYETRIDELYTLMLPDTTLHYNKWANPWAYGENQSFAQAIGYLKSDYLDIRRTHMYYDRIVSEGGNFVDAQVGNPAINIGTIEFNPSSGNQDEEYIELTNPNADAVDISDWKLTGGVTFTFESGTVIPAGETMYISPDLAAFRARSTSPTGNEANFVRGNYSGHLSSWGETVNLLAADDTLIDTVTYAGAPSDQQRYLRITEMMYHPINPPQPSPYNDEDFEYVELMNIGPTELDLGGVRFTNGISFAFASGETSGSDTLINITDSWRYEETDTDLGTSWRAYGYDDSLWPQGAALLYNEGSGLPAPKNTLLDLGPGGDRTRTFYFRRHFNLNADPAIDTITLQLNTVIDDGVVFYLNGTEVYRLGMHPTDTITHSTFANRTVGDAVYEGPFSIPTSSLLAGDNVLAVEVHQVTATSSDVVFGLTLDADIIYNDPAESPKIGPHEFALLVKSSLAFESRYGTGYNILGQYTGSLSNGGEEIKLEDSANSTILEYDYNDSWYDITDGSGFSLTIVDPNNPNLDIWDDKDGWRPSTVAGGTPGTDDESILNPGDIVINELLTHSDLEVYDWIELHNTTDNAVNIGGWFLSDSKVDDPNRRKYEIASGTTIDPNGYVVFYENLHFGNPGDPGCHVPFALSENGETLYLQSGESGVLTGYYDEEDFGASDPDVAFGRYYKSSTDSFNFVAMSTNTPGNLNAYPIVGPIVINEIMYHPQTNPDAEYIELLNISGSSVTLYDYSTSEPWQFIDDAGDPTPGIEFYFPTGAPVTMAPGEYLLLVKNLTAFNSEFTPAGGVTILEWSTGSLSNGGEEPLLSKPGDVNGQGQRQYIRIDKVNYDDEGLWPTGPDGNGDSLTRKNSTLYGNDVANWQSASPTPGQ